MYFTKDEVIELNDNKKYLVLDTTIINDVVYYKIKEVENENVIGNELYITTEIKDGKIYINDKLSEELIKLIQEKFQS